MGLATVTAVENGRLVLTCSGTAESYSQEQLSTTLSEVHRRATEQLAREVVADLRELEFASSSCLKAFVSWLQRVQELDDTRRYQVLFRSSSRYPWQRRSLGALAAFAGNVVKIETDPA